MLRNSFIFLERVNKKKEMSIWEQGVSTWDDFISCDEIDGISSFRKKVYDRELMKAKDALFRQDLAYFVSRMPTTEMWRLYGDFSDSCVFLDIETGYYRNDVVLVGLYDGEETVQLLQGKNLSGEVLHGFLSRFSLLITFNGSSFDIPVLKKRFREYIPRMPHVDLKHLCISIGLSGGLKNIEKELGFERDYSDFFSDAIIAESPVMLWDAWSNTGEDKYLEMLLRYNRYDIENLKGILDICYEKRKDDLNSRIVRSAYSL